MVLKFLQVFLVPDGEVEDLHRLAHALGAHRERAALVAVGRLEDHGRGGEGEVDPLFPLLESNQVEAERHQRSRQARVRGPVQERL